ncbi:hypothetical protein C4588_06900 [Candidatus Parcubacteria bacterium]|nr:MAG: hypothetical protein C4588_06900 [Candidatus Parcubacteria bacterium]
MSGLSIGAGDSVKYFFLTESPYEKRNVCYSHDLWFPRTWPIRGDYNDYGSIEDYDESSPAVFALIEGLKRDMIELGTGDNSIHDVPTQKGMPFDETLTAVLEHRIQVQREYNTFSDWRKNFESATNVSLPTKDEPLPEIPPGLPTLQNVSNIINSAGFSTNESNSGFLVDEIEYGWIRVRSSRFVSSPGELTSILPLLQKEFAAMITIGSGSYANNAEIQVMPLPQNSRYIHFRHEKNRAKSPLIINQAMIRSDVWDAILGASNFKLAREEIQKIWDQHLDPSPDSKFAVAIKELRHNIHNWAASLVSRSVIPFTMGLSEHFDLVVKQHQKEPFTETQIQEFLDDVAGFACIHEFLGPIRYWWKPSYSCGPQSPDYRPYIKWNSLLNEIVLKNALKEAEEMIMWGGEDNEQSKKTSEAYIALLKDFIDKQSYKLPSC